MAALSLIVNEARTTHGDGEEIITDMARLEAMAAEWRALERRSPERFGYFQTYDWCAGWAAHYPTGPAAVGSLHVLCIRRAERLVLLLPAMIKPGPLGIRVMQALGQPHTQYSTALYDPQHIDDRAIGSLRGALDEGTRADVADFQLVPAGSLLAGVLASLAPETGAANETALLNLDLHPTWEAYLAAMPASQRRKRKERSRRLAREGRIGFTVVWPQDPAFADMVMRCVAWKRRWLQETGRYSEGFALAGYDTFLAGLSGNERELTGAVAFQLTIDDQPVAVELGFIRNNEFYAYIGGFDWERRALSVGKVLMERIVQWLHESGVSAYDLLGNPAEYKATWSNETAALQGYTRPLTLQGRLYSQTWLNHIKPALKQVYGAVPVQVRRALLARVGGPGQPA